MTVISRLTMADDPIPVKRDASTSPLEIPDNVKSAKLENDDWSGMTDPKERRRRQNRVNQRAYRKRKQAQRQGLEVGAQSTTPEDEPTESTALTVSKPSTTSSRCLNPDDATALLERFAESAYESYILGSPASDHLLTLSKVNVFRAFASIMATLGMSPHRDYMHDDAISPFNTLQPGYILDANLPRSLRPTRTQQRIHHHPWLDFFPHPRMRDNLVAAGDAFDDEQLCIDIMGFWDMSNESCSLLVWGDPTDPGNWEVTEAFIRKWPWVIRGCGDLLLATNRWRAQRGERLIFRYL